MNPTNYVIVDTENSGAQRNKAHPFDPRNKLLLAGVRDRHSWTTIFDIDYSGLPNGTAIRTLGTRLLGNGVLIVGFNIKYDLHWLRRYGIPLGENVKIWDCQLAEFVLSNQTWQYPSLGESCGKRGVAQKKDTLQEYIGLGLDVSDIPLPELTEYLEGDLVSTEELFLKQVDLIREAGLWNLFRLQCQDLLVLADMEYNGMKYDLEKSKSLAQACQVEEDELARSLSGLVDPEIAPHINWNSGDHLSAILYGGRISFDVRHENGVYKSGRNVGKPRYRIETIEYTFPQLVKPLQGSELKKDGFYKTDIDTLKGIKAKGVAKQIVNTSLRLSELSKLRGTYYEGIPKKFDEYGWEDSLVHGQLNQCVAVTGRTSSSNPNGQNITSDVKECFVSRYQ